MISSKDRLYKVVWDIIQEIKEEGLIVPDDEWILINTPNDERRRALRYLDRLGTVKALEYGLLGPSSKVIRQINGEIHKVNVYKVDILRLKFDKIYEKFQKENDVKNTVRTKDTINGKSLVEKQKTHKWYKFSPEWHGVGIDFEFLFQKLMGKLRKKK